jgi:hypothetical protein
VPEGTPFDETSTPWRPWTPVQAARHLGAVPIPVRWAVAGGWAIDLFLGRVTRGHDGDEWLEQV